MIQISDNTQQIQPSKIRKMFNKALEYDRVLSFTLGEAGFYLPRQCGGGRVPGIREGKTKYSENAGLLALRRYARYLARTEGLSYNPASQIVVTPGAMGALFLALKVLLNPGDEVIVNEPCWTNYIQQIRMCGGVPVSVKTDVQRGFDLDVSAVAEAVTSKTKGDHFKQPHATPREPWPAPRHCPSWQNWLRSGTWWCWQTRCISISSLTGGHTLDLPPCPE